MPDDGLAVLCPGSPAEWDAWLTSQHADSPGLWLKIPRKGSGAPGISYADALRVALCHGWIDGQKGRLDDDYWLQRFTPRKAASKWSRINREQATALIEAGRMRPAGLREVERARADGRWPRPTSRRPPRGCPRTWPAPWRRRRGPRVLRHPGPGEPVRDPLPHRGRQAAGDPGPANRDVRHNA